MYIYDSLHQSDGVNRYIAKSEIRFWPYHFLSIENTQVQDGTDCGLYAIVLMTDWVLFSVEMIQSVTGKLLHVVVVYGVMCLGLIAFSYSYKL